MATNDFKPFAIGTGANVISQADYESLASLATGFQSGKASSAEINKALRQSTVMAAILSQFISDKSGQDVLDDGDTGEVLTNLLTALKTHGIEDFLQITNNFSEIKTAGPAALSAALNNLGLGAGSALPVGVPVPWSLAAAPEGWLKCNGASFSATIYPMLAKVYSGLKLPDLRGEFIRGWDDARGIDASRDLLSFQGDAIRNIMGVTGSTKFGAWLDSPTGVFTTQYSSYMQSIGTTVSTANALASVFDASRVVPTASENRPRNIAFNYIVKAA